jgi:zinc protease
MMIDRTIEPKVHEIQGISLPLPVLTPLSGGAPLYAHQAGTEDIVRLEVVFHAGLMHQNHPLTANATLQMMQEGTSSSSAAAIAEALEYYGAYLNVSVDTDFATFSLHCMYEYLEDLLPVLAEMISFPEFPQERFEVFMDKQRQSFNVNLQKVDFLARRRFHKELFGDHHPMGYQAEASHYESLNTDMLKSFHKSNYQNGCAALFMGGRADDEAIRLVDKHLGFLHHALLSASPQTDFSPSKAGLFIEHKADAVQSGIRMGCRTIMRNHPDYAGLQVLNTLLGGYFGSRLMQSIREDLGYTYGIGSFFLPSLQHTYFAIGTETGAEVTMAALEAIHKEIDGIRLLPPDNDELHLVKNYMLGKLLKSTDGALARADRIKTMVLYNLPFDYFENFEKVIREINTGELLALHNKYLNYNVFVEVIAGNSMNLTKTDTYEKI